MANLSPQDVLSASSDELRVWVALLEGWTQCSPFNWRKGGCFTLPAYTTSLDDLWPVQEATVKKGVRAFYEALWLVVFEDEVDADCWPRLMFDHATVLATASAQQRARAICLARIDELNELLENKEKP